ncbi:ABC transporter ATP-binding protein [Polaromonas sp. SM01]|uniref:ABC transporter ATP-binding protein n=1 Tax=Polaromonas sp. SM01 TaxID=3085630 RepID=UPI002980A3B4|nr:ABC transporter ATP-binding protein [Polaromonas sp. SM01]MDW5442339.1 ABC transporter ATP-binding protein [Polaromonas sp. SM01]
MSSSTEPVLVIDQLHVALPPGSDRAYAVEDVSFSIHPGKTLCVVGESGSGKSVMATAVMGLLAPELQAGPGSIVLQGESLLLASAQRLRSLRGQAMGMVFQEPMTALNPVMTCGDQIDELLRQHTDWGAKRRSEAVLDIVRRVKLPEPERMVRSYPHQLSGGQRQRIVIAMAVILQPALLICDEPTTALDVTTQKEIIKLIAALQEDQSSGHRQACAVLFITHDMGVVAEIADDVLVMHQGRAVEYGTRDAVLNRPQADYTKMLLAAVPSMTPPPARPAPSSAPLLRGQDVSKTYMARDWLGRSRPTHALQAASVAVHAGETVGVVGESGSGKSTLARCLIRLIDPTGGQVLWGRTQDDHRGAVLDVANFREGQLRPLRSQVQVVFQDPNRSLNPRRKVGDSIVEGAINFGATHAEAMALAVSLMDKVRLPAEGLQRYPSQFSGGQRQRIAIARALACRPRVLVADEAVSALDVSVQAQILKLLREIQAELGLGLLFITHDLRVAAQLCDRVIVMHQGRIVEEGPTAELYARPQHDYTRRLLAAAPGALS